MHLKDQFTRPVHYEANMKSVCICVCAVLQSVIVAFFVAVPRAVPQLWELKF